MKVLFLGLHRSRKSGVAKVQIELSSALKNEGIIVDEISTQTIPGHEFTKNNEEILHFESLDNFLNYVENKKPYDVLHSHSWAWSPKEMPEDGLEKVKNRFSNAKVIHTLHGLIPKEHEAQRSILKFVDTATVLTYSAKKSFSQIFDGLNYKPEVKVIPNIIKTVEVDDELVKFTKSKIAQKNEKIILYVGRLEEDKGVIELSYAFKDVSSRYKNIKLLVVGSSKTDYKEKMKDILQGTNYQFTGWVSEHDVSLYQKISDIQMLPSKFEGFPLAPAKGLLNGCVIAVSDIPALREIYHLNNLSPFAIKISPAASIDGIINSLEEFLKNPESFREMVKRGQKEIKELYSPDKIAKKYIEAYSKS